MTITPLLFVGLLLVVTRFALASPFIPNASFEEGSTPGGVGYGAIEGWDDPWASSGLNPAGGQSPFADNGVIPHGSRVAFLQGTNNVRSLSTTISGLTVGTTYRVAFRANARIAFANGLSPFLEVRLDDDGDAIDDGERMALYLDLTGNPNPAAQIIPVGAGQPYRYLSFRFTAGHTSAGLKLSIIATGDQTILFDDFTITEEQIVTAPWTNDASSGISSDTSLWAYQFGSAANTAVDGFYVTGIETPAGSQIDTPNFTLIGPSNRSADTNNLTGVAIDPGTRVIAQNFIFGGTTSTIVLKKLTAGRNYTLSLLSASWSDTDPRFRAIKVTSGTTSRVISPLEFGYKNGTRIDIPFTAAGNSHTITAAVANPNNATFHFHGFSLNSSQPAPGQRYLVSSTNNSGPGSLREALAIAAQTTGPNTITFDESLDGETITLTSEFGNSESLIIADTEGLTLDASALPNGISLTPVPLAPGGFTEPALVIQAGVTVTMNGVNFIGSNGRDGSAIVNNGALIMTRCLISHNTSTSLRTGGNIYNNGYLQMNDCTISNNTGGIYNDMFRSADFNRCLFLNNSGVLGNFGNVAASECSFIGNGSALYNSGGTATIVRSTFSNNSANFGPGAISHDNGGRMSLIQCTFTGNTTLDRGGAIQCNSEMIIDQCTISGNAANNTIEPLDARGGGGISMGDFPGTKLTLINSIVAGNTSNYAPDIREFPQEVNSLITLEGLNIIGNLSGSLIDSGDPAVLVTNPLLGPLAYNGGPTQTMALLPGSPARNAAVNSIYTTDQRGYLIRNTADIGAYEVGITLSFDVTLKRNGGNLEVRFPTQAGLTHTLQFNNTMEGVWTNTALTFTEDASVGFHTFSFPIPLTSETPQRFYRIRVE